MDFTYISSIDNGIVVHDVRNFEPKHIFDCGQCFRWREEKNGNYIGIAYGKVIEIEKINNDIIIYNSNEEDFNNIWMEYFDLNRDYGTIKEILSRDILLKEAVNYGYGIRILKQEPFEIIISFIISANNRIPMIKKCIQNICIKWGKIIDYKGETYYAFPTPYELKDVSIEELQSCSLGFRAKYVKETIDKINEKCNNISCIINMKDNTCHEALQEYDGIGPKVADCIMLFSMGKYSAFPVDVWVKRAMRHFYVAPDVSLKKIRDFGREKFGELSGFAQQYLFYYARENKIDI